nr:MAG: hypothetical protein H3Bulk42418_000002 [Mitovirus sp.]
MAQYLKYKLARHGVEVKWTDIVPRVLGVVPRVEQSTCGRSPPAAGEI